MAGGRKRIQRSPYISYKLYIGYLILKVTFVFLLPNVVKNYNIILYLNNFYLIFVVFRRSYIALMYFSSRSIIIMWCLPNLFVTTPVVLVPANVSRTISPSFVDTEIILSKSIVYFWAYQGELPDDSKNGMKHEKLNS